MTDEQLREMDAEISRTVTTLNCVFKCDVEGAGEFTDDRDWTVEGEWYYRPNGSDPVKIPHYSTDPADSKLLRDKLAERWDWSMSRFTGKLPYGFSLYEKGATGEPYIAVFSDTEPLAVALCALRSVGAERKG